MNLELIKEINTLKDEDKTYTEIAEITGLARTSIVLSLRLNKIFSTKHSKQISSLNKTILSLQTTIAQYKDGSLKKESEIQKLQSLVNMDYEQKLRIYESKISNLDNELNRSKNELDTYKRKLHYKEEYLKNLSIVDKMKILFS